MNKLLHCPWLLGPNGWQPDVLLQLDEHGHIAAMGTGGDERARRLPGPVLPGMVNVHSHAHQRLMAGLSGRRSQGEDSFWSWREQMYAAIGLLRPEELTLLATWLYMELLEGGYTTQGEFHYPHRLAGQAPEASSAALIRAAELAGCALTLLPVWYRYAGFGRQAPTPAQQGFILDAAAFQALIERLEAQVEPGSLLRIGLAPHSLRAVDVSELAELLTRLPGRPVHIHISEQPAEVQACLTAHGRRPIQLLAEHVRLDQRWCLIHGTHADEQELAIAAEADVVIGLCPTTEADLGDGLFPAAEWLSAGGRFAIGSDSNLHTSAAGELRLLEWTQRLRRHGRNVLIGPQGGHIGSALWAQTAAAGARALDQPCGSLAPGHRADLVVLEPSHPLLAGLGPAAMLDTWIMAEQPGMLNQVWVGGQCLVDEGRHRHRAPLQRDFIALRGRLAAATGMGA
ncbi:MAG: formimidoylglutamate deiminase [Wenzhouxiangella sp.]|nr:formimidoylglutamate deiminase [Wenzhouxiangella sp.]